MAATSVNNSHIAVASSSKNGSSGSKNSKKKRKRTLTKHTLDLCMILKNRQYRSFDAIAFALYHSPRALVDAFCTYHYLQSGDLRTMICSILRLSIHHLRPSDRSQKGSNNTMTTTTRSGSDSNHSNNNNHHSSSTRSTKSSHKSSSNHHTSSSSKSSNSNNKMTKSSKNSNSPQWITTTIHHPADTLTAALLLTLPFVHCSRSILVALVQKYVMQWDAESGFNLCRSLVFGLRMKLNVVSLSIKNHILCTLCNVIEYQQRFKLSSKIRDAFGGLVQQSLQILQCDRSWLFNKVFKFKQYAVRILMCELNEGVMARQGLKDQMTNLIVLQTVLRLHETCELVGNIHNRFFTANLYELEASCQRALAFYCPNPVTVKEQYDDYQYLMVKLLRFLYRAFDFEDLWLSEDDYRSRQIETEGLDLLPVIPEQTSKSSKKKKKERGSNSKQSKPANDLESQRDKHFYNFLMTRPGFARLLQLKLTQILHETQATLVKISIKLLLEYPLNDQYGLTVMTPCIIASQQWTESENFNVEVQNQFTQSMGPSPSSQSQSQQRSKSKKKGKQKGNKQGKKQKKGSKQKNSKQKVNGLTDEVLLDLLPNDQPNDANSNGSINGVDGTESGNGNGKGRSRYSGPNWDYEYDRLLKNEFGIKMTTQADLVALNQNLLDRNWMRYQNEVKGVREEIRDRKKENNDHEKKQRNGHKKGRRKQSA